MIKEFKLYEKKPTAHLRMSCMKTYAILCSSLLGAIGILFAPEARALHFTTIDLASGHEDVLIYGSSTGDRFSFNRTIGLGDINGDGISDLIIGSLAADGPGDTRPLAGEAYIFFGSATWDKKRDAAGAVAAAPDVTIYGAGAGDILTMGGAIAVGDLNDDGIGDLVLGARDADGPAESRINSGEAYIIYGSNTWPATIDLANGDQDVIIYARRNGDLLTQNGGILIGDLNDDGVDDLILGAPQTEGPGNTRPDSGEV